MHGRNSEEYLIELFERAVRAEPPNKLQTSSPRPSLTFLLE